MKTELKKLQRFKSYGQKKIYTEIRAIFLCILTQNFNQLEGPLKKLRFVSNFFGSSPIATEWDKIVAEIIHTTFVFLGHPTTTHHPLGFQRSHICNILVCFLI